MRWPHCSSILQGIKGDAVGLFEHYGNIGYISILPLCFCLTSKSISIYDDFMKKIRTIIILEKFEMECKIDDFLERNYINDPFLIIKYVFILIGILFFIYNGKNTLDPQLTISIWRHDVYDSRLHLFSFMAMRFFFLIWWGYLIPILG